jgi:DNA-binding NarL/FixJ family response regulator
LGRSQDEGRTNFAKKTVHEPPKTPSSNAEGVMNTRMQPSSARQIGVGTGMGTGTEVGLGTARVVVVDDNQLRATSFAAAIKASADVMITIVPSDSGTVDQLAGADLVLLALGGRNVSALATGAEAVQRNPFAEVVFYCDNPDAPEVSAAGVLGITRIVPAQQMVGWLSRAGELLARGAFLRRAAAAAIASAPRPPTLASVVDQSPRPIPLPTAEMQFRESYIRHLLTQSGGRQEAARRAGVPYRTMCEMIRKLGISAD